MHKSYLEFGFHVEDLLFKGLTIQSVGGMVGLCISVAIFTFIYESVKTMRQKLVSSLSKNSHQDPRYSPLHSDSHSERSMLVEMRESQWKWKRLQVHTVHALLYMIQVTMGYLLMLIIMSYNAWLAITVFAAAGFSYYFFSTFVLYRPSVVPIEILAPESCE